MPDFSAQRFFVLLLFFMLGVWMSQRPGMLSRVLSRRWVVWLCAAVSTGTLAAVALGVGLRYEAISVPFAAAGIGLALLAARRWGSAAAFRPLRFVGRDSLVYYIVHWWPTSLGVAIGAVDRQRLDRTSGGSGHGPPRQHRRRVAHPPVAPGQLAVLGTSEADRADRVAIQGFVLGAGHVAPVTVAKPAIHMPPIRSRA